MFPRWIRVAPIPLLVTLLLLTTNELALARDGQDSQFEGGTTGGFQGSVGPGGFQGQRFGPGSSNEFGQGSRGRSGRFRLPGGNEPSGKQSSGSGQRVMQEMGFTQEQMDQIKAIQQKAHSQAQPLKQTLEQKRKEMMEYVSSPGATEAQALSKQREFAQLQNQLSELRIKTWFKMKDVMSPEQLQRYTQLHQRAQQFRSKGRVGDGNTPNGSFFRRQFGGNGTNGPQGNLWMEKKQIYGSQVPQTRGNNDDNIDVF